MRACCGLLVLCVVPCVLSLVDLPHRARGGTAWAEEMRRRGAAAEARPATTQSDGPFWVTQPLDHFHDPGANTTSGTFKQRFWADSSQWNCTASSSGPIFLYIGGEGPQTSTPAGWVGELAAEHGALIVALEHRCGAAAVHSHTHAVLSHAHNALPTTPPLPSLFISPPLLPPSHTVLC